MESSSPSAENAVASADDGLTVLVVDDTESNRRLLVNFLTTLGHRSIQVANGLQAVDYCRSHRPDLILMDVVMPEMDGFLATQKIREILGKDWVPIIFLTALADQANMRKGLEIGGDDYLHKPFDFTLLAAKINVLMRIRQLQEHILHDTQRLSAYYLANEQDQQLAKHILSSIVGETANQYEPIRQWIKPAVTFSGDVTCIQQSPKGNIHLLLADSTGTGLTAAICCLPAVSGFVAMTKRGFDINAIAREINESTYKQLPTGRFVAAALISIDYVERTLSVWNGGIPCVIYATPDGEILRRFDSAFPPLGTMDDGEFDSTLEVFQWEKPGQLIVASDGVSKASNASGAVFDIEGIAAAIRNTPNDSIASIADAWQRHLGELSGNDDASVIVAECSDEIAAQLPKPSSSSRFTHTVAVNWEIALSFTAEQLRTHDCFQAIVGWLNQIGLEQSQFSALLLILSELFNNALDHGLLSLSSSLKTADGGFEKYLSQRQERLQNLAEGKITVGLSRNQSTDDPKLRLWLEDSGPGFDYSGFNTQVTGSSMQVHGRGISLIAMMCESIRYVGKGNRVEVVFAL